MGSEADIIPKMKLFSGYLNLVLKHNFIEHSCVEKTKTKDLNFYEVMKRSKIF